MNGLRPKDWSSSAVGNGRHQLCEDAALKVDQRNDAQISLANKRAMAAPQLGGLAAADVAPS